MKERRLLMAFKIDTNKCIRCGICENECYFDAISFDGEYHIDAVKCKTCGQCYEACPMSAIHPSEVGQKRIKRIQINEEKCIGCSLCERNCPVKAITGVIKESYRINEGKCLHCGICATKCRYDAFEIEYRID